ncbi:MAG: ATP-binding cassette domain-containing protein, partial [bacterium]
MIKLKEINKTYYTGKTSLHVLKGVNLDIDEGELVSIMGSSGSGKSTMLNIIGMLDNYDKGEFYLNGQLIGKM